MSTTPVSGASVKNDNGRLSLSPQNPSSISFPEGSSTQGIELSVFADSNPETSLNASNVITPEKRRKEVVALITLCWSLFLAGWNDATLGPLLPTIQHIYKLGFAVVSIMFISNCVGFISAAIANVHLTDRFGFGKVLLLGSICNVVAYTIMAPAPPFPVLCLSYALNGFGLGLQNAQANGFVASLKQSPSTKMGFLHASYGAGAFVSPLVATQFAQMPRWSFHYLCSLSLAACNAVGLLTVFRGRPLDDILNEVGSSPDPSQGSATISGSKYKEMMKQNVMHLLAIFVFIYVGIEVSIGGWIATFIINKRGGDASAGYISSGFFGGLMLGRVALLWVNQKIGERRAIFVYGAFCIGLEITVWFIPSLIGNAVAVSLVGVLLGPMYPLVMNQTGRVIPRGILTASIGWIAGFGQAGSAALPFMTGALAGKFGIGSLQPLLVSMMAFKLMLWGLVPKEEHRID